MQATKTPVLKRLYWISMVIILILFIAFIIQIRHQRNIQTAAAIQPSCDIQKDACIINLTNGPSIHINVTPKPFQKNQSITVDATISKLTPTGVSLLIMPITNASDTHIQPTPLEKRGSMEYSATVAMPNIPLSEHTWVLMLFIQTKATNYAIPFRFQA